MKLSDLIEQLKPLVPIAEAVPILGSRVKGSIEAAIKVAEMAEVSNALGPLGKASRLELRLQAAKSNKEDMETLARQVGQWASDLCKGLAAARPGSLAKIEEDVEEALKCVYLLIHEWPLTI